MSEHDQLCENYANLPRACYCQQRKQREYVEDLESQNESLKAKLAVAIKALEEIYEGTTQSTILTSKKALAKIYSDGSGNDEVL